MLDATVGENLRGEQYVHRCHQHLGQRHELLCVGFMRHCDEQQVPNSLLVMGQRLGVIDLDALARDDDIAESWEEVLEIHARRCAGHRDR